MVGFRLGAVLAGVAWLGLSAPVGAQAPATTAPQPVAVSQSEQFDLKSQATGRDYRIFIARPFTPAPAAGYPVVYVLDANGEFLTAAETSRLRSLTGEIAPAVVVGIGYPTDNPLMVLRRRNADFTPDGPDAATQAVLGPMAAAMAGATYGDLANFLKMIEAEVKPAVAARVKVDPARSTLFGHSLGGLAVLHALFDDPSRFQTYVSVSPSIWWNQRAVLAKTDGFLAKIRSGATKPRVMIGVGALEAAAPASAPEAIRRSSEQALMVGNAEALAAKLRAGGVDVRSYTFPGETHMSVVGIAVNRGLELALSN